MKKENIYKIIFVGAGLTAIFLLAFQYSFFANFPIGHDSGHHTQVALEIQKNGFMNFSFLKTVIYPIPLEIYAVLQKITHIELSWFFIILICSFLFLTSLAWAYFATKITDKIEIGIFTGIFLASSRWLSDALRIGFLAEAWAWFVFIICSYFLVRRKLLAFLISLIVLFFSHPMVFAVFIIIFVIYSLVILFSKPSADDKSFLLRAYSIFLLASAFLLIFFPEKIQIYKYLTEFSYLEGARSLKDILIDSDKRRILIYIFSLIGVVKSVKFWQKSEIKFLYVLLFVSIFLTQLYLWKINFWVFRFYPYFEIAASAFAALGLYHLIEVLPKILTKYNYLKILIFGLMIYFLVSPNWIVSRDITNWQKSQYQLLFTCPPNDRQAFIWVKNNLPNDAVILSKVRWGAWLGPLSGKLVIESDDTFNPNLNLEGLKKYITSYKINYIYLSSIQATDQIIENQPQYFEKIYSQNMVRIYKVRNYAF